MGSADDPHVGIPASDNGAGRFVSTAMNGSGGPAARTNGHAATNGHVNGHDHSGMHLPATGSSRVLVLNASYEPINVCTVRRATVLVLKERAEMLERGEGALHSERLEMARPCVIRLHRYVRIPRDVHRRKITRKAVLARDAWTCQYCGRQAAGLTVDHVIPRSRGGDSEWDNIVAACAPCNRRKGNRTPREARMHPATRPKPPGPTVFIRIASPRIPVAWESYLGLAPA
jgi:5-methylcytosine-specific restriction endonuclease McrA